MDMSESVLVEKCSLRISNQVLRDFPGKLTIKHNFKNGPAGVVVAVYDFEGYALAHQVRLLDWSSFELEVFDVAQGGLHIVAIG